MGEVFRATDSALGRDVAVKVLPEAFRDDPERLARFEQEARTLASLNHPNIAQVYGLEQGALVMELLDGVPLREPLQDGPLPVRKAIEYASQIARGLAAAHDRGIIHRDLKPDNVFVLRDGQVKILDFGLARRAVPESSGATETVASPALTDPGVVMGTVAYMAPEQVRGAGVDARTDLFALGVVLYEMLTGRQAFRRETSAETMTAVLREDPADITSIRPDLPPTLDRIVRHCLEKNPLERFQTARDVAFALGALAGSGPSAAQAALDVAQPAGRRRERVAWAAVTVALLGTLAWLVWSSRPRAVMAPQAPMRSVIFLPEGVEVSPNIPGGARLGISPGGSEVVFSGRSQASQETALWALSLRDNAARAVPDSRFGAAPHWSPDGRTLAFTTPDAMKRLPADGTGAPTVILPQGGLGSWGADDVILFRPWGAEYFRTTATGAAPQKVFPERGSAQIHIFAIFLSNGKDFLYGFRDPDRADTSGTYVRSLDRADARLLLPRTDSFNAIVRNGHMLYARGSELFARRFDESRLELLGDEQRLVDGVAFTPSVGADFAASSNGILVYVPHTGQEHSRLVWMDRTGSALDTVADAADYSNLELSPDGKRLLVSVTDPTVRTRDIYIVDLARGLRQRFTFDPSDERSAVWSPDGSRVLYTSKGLDLYEKSSDFTGTERPMQVDHRAKDPRGYTPDGKGFYYRVSVAATGNDVMVQPLAGGPPVPLLDSTFDENYATYSPDGQSLLYVSDASGRPEVYVMSLAGGGRVQISAEGGTMPRWRRDGREIVYPAPGGVFMSVPVTGSGSTFRAGAPVKLFTADVRPSAGSTWDMTSDGQRFIVNTAIPSRVPPHLVVIANWTALLRE